MVFDIIVYGIFTPVIVAGLLFLLNPSNSSPKSFSYWLVALGLFIGGLSSFVVTKGPALYILSIFLPTVIFFWPLQAKRTLFDSASAPQQGAWFGGFAMMAGFSMGFAGLFKIPTYPFSGTYEWMILLAPLAMIFVLIKSSTLLPSWLMWLLRAGLGVFTVWITLKPLVPYTWKQSMLLSYTVGLALLMLACWWLLQQLSRPLADSSFAWYLMVWMIGGSVLLTMGGSIRFGQIGGLLAATLGTWWVFSLLRPDKKLAPGVLPVFVLLSFALFINASFYSELPKSCALLAASGLLLAWIVESLPFLSQRWLKITLSTIAIIGTIGSAITIIHLQSAGQETPYYGLNTLIKHIGLALL